MLHTTQSQLDEVWSGFRPDVLQTDVEALETLRVPAGLTVMPVVRAVGRASARDPRILFEGPVSGAGSTSDWHTAARLARTTPPGLAGGRDATHVADAIAVARRFGQE